MLNLRNSLQPSVMRFKRGRFHHQFGGSPVHEGSTPKGRLVPMHLLALLDLNDPLVPIVTDQPSLTRVPLYYPLRYDCGGGRVQYAVESDRKIIVFDGDEEDQGLPDTENLPFPNEFPQLDVSLEPLTYRQHRALLVADRDLGIYENDPARKQDRELLRMADLERAVRFDDVTSLLQGSGSLNWACRNPNCEWRGSHDIRTEVFASFPGRLTDEVSIWGDYGDDVVIYFCLHYCCCTIVAMNQCG